MAEPIERLHQHAERCSRLRWFFVGVSAFCLVVLLTVSLREPANRDLNLLVFVLTVSASCCAMVSQRRHLVAWEAIQQRGHCGKCAYDLRATHDGRCPECGHHG